MAETYYTDYGDTGIRAHKWKGISTDDLDATQAENAAKLAYEHINSVLGSCYSVPFSTSSPPSVVREISDMLTIYYAKSFTTGHGIITKGPWTTMKDVADAWLDELRAGRRSITGVSRLMIADSSTRGYHPIFDLAGDQDIDEDLKDKILDDRGENT